MHSSEAERSEATSSVATHYSLKIGESQLHIVPLNRTMM